MRFAPVLLLAVSLLGCVGPNDALHDATLSTAPGAPGYLVVGLAEQNYRWDLAGWTQSISLTLAGPGQQPIIVTRRGCGSITGLIGDTPCDLSRVDYVVLKVQPGTYTATQVNEAYHLPNGDHSLQAAPPAAAITVGAGQIIYGGDFIFASDADTGTIRFVGQARNAAAAQRALAPFTHLRSTPVVYGGPPLPS